MMEHTLKVISNIALMPYLISPKRLFVGRDSLTNFCFLQSAYKNAASIEVGWNFRQVSKRSRFLLSTTR